MTPQLTKEFKINSTEFMLDISKQLILENFDNNNKYNKTINIDNDNYTVEISRNCFTHISKPYFEDYSICFKAIIQNEPIYSAFYLEWKNNDMNTELIPATTLWNTDTGKCSNRKIIIQKCK